MEEEQMEYADDLERLDEEEPYDEEHSAILGFMKGYELDQQGLIDEAS